MIRILSMISKQQQQHQQTTTKKHQERIENSSRKQFRWNAERMEQRKVNEE